MRITHDGNADDRIAPTPRSDGDGTSCHTLQLQLKFLVAKRIPREQMNFRHYNMETG
ncbi:uncharacterized protein BDV17DRAFT_264794 [Aspergillus undulatus]|uniref:uncharacterized protein n=1 Tax=Aspergillus undulatus TaxID=1810928 RepID=UPI003CCE0DF3